MITPKTLPELVKDFKDRATGARMASGVSTIKKGSCQYNQLLARAETWSTAARLLENTLVSLKSDISGEPKENT